MPHFKTETLGFSDHEKTDLLKVKISINADGEFYCDPPAVLEMFFEPFSDLGQHAREVRVTQIRGKRKVISPSYSSLKSALADALSKRLEPEVKTEPVIRFNIETHVSFALDEAGKIYPNCTFPGTLWPDIKDSRYGGHHASNPSRGGYCLAIGAKAFIKITTIYGSVKKESYAPYYKGESHLGNENPAQKLNSWCGFSLPKDAREIPYTDDSALFFYDLMMGMARLTKMIQDRTFDNEALLQLIQSSSVSNLLGTPAQNVE
ncbi:hypothetical protein [Marinobacter salicampi]|uniref:hypothetical protein n=1 Tax=Marinobacter salicampi TaxID=435907 RepID=UPI00140B826F|nr:hypothetical protein [Marinobacter salicampi]